MEYAIEVSNLTKKYRDFTLDNISLKVPSGTIIGLIGENGAGKSTFINAILGIINSNYDQLKYFDLNFKDNEQLIKEQIAVIFDATHYNLEFTPKLIGLILSKTYQNWNNEVYY